MIIPVSTRKRLINNVDGMPIFYIVEQSGGKGGRIEPSLTKFLFSLMSLYYDY